MEIEGTAHRHGVSVADLFNSVRAAGLPARREGAAVDPEVTGATLDSRRVSDGDLYAALPGFNLHGAGFTRQAVEAGAACVLTDDAGVALIDPALFSRVPVIVVPEPRAILGQLSAAIFQTEQHSPILFGVTGTNGKTTTTFILDALLREIGYRTGMIGTIETRIADRVVPSIRTTPESPDFHSLLAQMYHERVTACSMEVSSHALSLHRVDGARFEIAGFTNLSQDHLDFHPTMDDYFDAKASLFTESRAHKGVVVIDDEWGRRLAAEAEIPVTTLLSRPPAPPEDPDYWIEPAADDPSRFTLHGRKGTHLAAHSPLPGGFNRTNTALAILMLHSAGVSTETLSHIVNVFRAVVPGRMELVNPEHPRAIVDYSHTPESVGLALAALSDDAAGETAGPLVVVLGAGGDRDKGKRPLMGRRATLGADVVIVTDDNPRSEDPAQIRTEVLRGARGVHDGARASKILEVGDRTEAISAGLRAAGRDGTLLVAGKGHEQGQEVAGVVSPFDDREQIRLALARLRHDDSSSR
ncbi:UDP-N-acetylmuramoyl-L-alanyl-D-glutamate--2,6-diaminopimelate ligase [Saxibacter everestensis]|uniref:UDP-N-acetylmuramoyl-L-alanyl-D-glutamate--2,6-diaminopimelate ligase n=1 Tax=Saxibacter everestensis TaxID=2909229 RepID=A0ABY8QW93_9MICO|nr:UDP-N-acetylmuramoyl-L-alanyl-D-glutamate--2,6-diaminopimelate ligase [Brevibacteriaceae bacterium ZFBP1038]